MMRARALRLILAAAVLAGFLNLLGAAIGPPSVVPRASATDDDKGKGTSGGVGAAAVAFSTIGQGNPAAPLKANIGIDLGYQTFYDYNDGSAVAGQFFPPSGSVADGGTLLWINGQVYGPDFRNHGSTATGCAGQVTSYTPVSQVKSGSGTSADPYRVITVVNAGPVQVEETVTLVDGEKFITIRRVLSNSSGSAVQTAIFHAADIYLKGSDKGYGYYDAASQSVGGYNLSRDWYEIFTPVDPPQRYQEDAYCTVWEEIFRGTSVPGNGLTNTVDLEEYQDNGIALRWDRLLNPGQSTSVTDFHSFGVVPVIPSTPGVCLTPNPLTLGTQVVGNSSPSYFVTLNNCGNAPLSIGTLTLGGANPGDFTFVSSCPNLVIPAGSSCGIRATFKPTDVGARSATITIFDNAGDSPQTLVLNGNGVPPHPPYRLTLVSDGPCAPTIASPPGPSYPDNASVTITPNPAPGAIFIGWRSSGVFKGWADPWSFQMNDDYTITAVCVQEPSFPDWNAAQPRKIDPIIRLAALGIIRGYEDGRFGPGDTTLRAQMAALIARGVRWDAEEHGNFFPDKGFIDDNLWRNIGTLYYYNVARGYQDGTFDPTGEVLYAQTISFIVRGMVTNGYWTQQPDNLGLYPNVPLESGHRSDLATYVFYAGALPDFPSGGSFAPWDQPSPRAWFARAEWQALDSYFSKGFTP